MENLVKNIKHNYTNELELKSLLIRIKNERENIGNPDDNRRINKYIKWHTDINNKKYTSGKKNNVKVKLKDTIIKLSEGTYIDKDSYERLGSIILLMIKNILKKPQFSGYTYKDDFYSDAVYKILKYLGNFNHKLISERTGLNVNAFAYISQIIHHSILFIINTKKKEFENHRKHLEVLATSNNIPLVFDNWYADSDHEEPKEKIKKITIRSISGTLYDEIIKLHEITDNYTRIDVIYPKNYVITFDEYNKLKGILKGKISILRAKKI